ncbi:hypothetical protein PoB_007662000 [Plakobranchus ocellatus]|uniref:Uncharacterized protein n=1 Tax=Plakobranchus ocellatus TaxID=259542 RepID=A0AAV4E1A7_9GAST|nr:hypothetical protein PoB_007662000 [Plakobranchus ocellatus]
MESFAQGFWFLYMASPQQGGPRLLGSPSGHSTGGGARTRDRRMDSSPAQDIHDSDQKSQCQVAQLKRGSQIATNLYRLEPTLITKGTSNIASGMGGVGKCLM